MRTETRLPERIDVQPARPRDDRFLMVGLAAAAVWIAVGAASLFAPDMVTGSLQEHLPIAALTMWLWGAIATGFILRRVGHALAGVRHHGGSDLGGGGRRVDLGSPAGDGNRSDEDPAGGVLSSGGWRDRHGVRLPVRGGDGTGRLSDTGPARA
jgi:hypothetical protein